MIEVGSSYKVEFRVVLLNTSKRRAYFSNLYIYCDVLLFPNIVVNRPLSPHTILINLPQRVLPKSSLENFASTQSTETWQAFPGEKHLLRRKVEEEPRTWWSFLLLQTAPLTETRRVEQGTSPVLSWSWALGKRTQVPQLIPAQA